MGAPRDQSGVKRQAIGIQVAARRADQAAHLRLGTAPAEEQAGQRVHRHHPRHDRKDDPGGAPEILERAVDRRRSGRESRRPCRAISSAMAPPAECPMTMRGAASMFVHERRDVPRDLRQARPAPRALGEPVARQVGRDQAKAVVQTRHQPVPCMRRGARAVQEQDVRTRPGHLHVPAMRCDATVRLAARSGQSSGGRCGVMRLPAPRRRPRTRRAHRRGAGAGRAPAFPAPGRRARAWGAGRCR
jgi:hypothetical protein